MKFVVLIVVALIMIVMIKFKLIVSMMIIMSGLSIEVSLVVVRTAMVGLSNRCMGRLCMRGPAVHRGSLIVVSDANLVLFNDDLRSFFLRINVMRVVVNFVMNRLEMGVIVMDVFPMGRLEVLVLLCSMMIITNLRVMVAVSGMCTSVMRVMGSMRVRVMLSAVVVVVDGVVGDLVMGSNRLELGDDRRWDLLNDGMVLSGVMIFEITMVYINVNVMVIVVGIMVHCVGKLMLIKVSILIIVWRIMIHMGIMMVIKVDMVSIIVSIFMVHDRSNILVSMDELWMEIAGMVRVKSVMIFAIKRERLICEAVMVNRVMCLRLNRVQKVIIDGTDVVL